MRSRILALTLSLSLVVSSLAAATRPAKADEELLGQLVLGAIAAGIAYQVLRNDDPAPRVSQAPRAKPPLVRPRARAIRDADRRETWNAPSWTPREKRRACRQSLPTRRGDVVFIADRCLNHPRANPRIPQSCLRDRWISGDWRQVYSRQCLARYGEVH